jgi:predicted 3-demethylubiquinone-9 3-methyltransferase (glyoxalase superfamily)
MRTLKITVCLWFDDRAAEAASFYVSISRTRAGRCDARYDEQGAKAAGRPKGSMMTLVVNCETETEVDAFWSKLSAGGQQVQCGWLKDRFGVSWQIVPTVDIATLENAYEGRSGSAA